MLTSDLNPDLPAQREILDALGPQIRRFMDRHRDSRKLWMPSELMPANEQADPALDLELEQLRQRAKGLPDGYGWRLPSTC